MSDYAAFVEAKIRRAEPMGRDLSDSAIHPRAFAFQRHIIRWAVKRGRAAIFADTGLGKTLMEIEWAKAIGGRSLILAPLAVAAQTTREGTLLDAEVVYCKDDSEVRDGINITNYDRLHKFDLERFDAIILDESSILKSFDGKTRSLLLDQCRAVPYRLACTATPAPNDTMELGNHAEFLGTMTVPEMLATYFTHDLDTTQKWRLKGHAEKEFWRWVSSWAIVVGKPSDLGYQDDGYVLPPLRMHEHIVDVERGDIDSLFALPAQTLMERRRAKSQSVSERVEQAAKIVSGEGPWLVWCDLNREADALADVIPTAVEVRGSDDSDKKRRAAIDFADGRIPILVSKPSIFGFGMNFQVCSKMVFVGINDSFESLYQAIRRCWRFGQSKPVDVHLILSQPEHTVLANLKRKEAEAQRMRRAMVEHAMAEHRPRTSGVRKHKVVEVPAWL